MLKETKFSKNLLKRNNAVGITHGTSYVDKRSVVKAFQKTKAGYKKDLFSNMKKLMNGKIDKDEYMKLQKETISSHFTNSFLLGKRFNQNSEVELSDSERRFIVYQTTDELKYMSKFADDMLSSSGKMSYRRRMNMYAAGLDPMFKLGDIAYLPDNIQIKWILGITDKHCLDCLFFAKDSPYTKKTLPGIPKSCNTACLSNCRCRLEYITDTVDTKYTNFIIDNYSGSRENIPTEQDFGFISAQIDEYYQKRLRYELTKDKSLMVGAKLARNRMNNFIILNGLAVSVPLYIASPISELKRFKNHDSFEFVTSTSDLSDGEMVSAFVRDTQHYAKVAQIDGDSVIIKTLSGELIELDINNDVIFKAK